MKCLLPFLFLFFYACADGQPGTDIYLFDLKIKGKKVSVSNPVNITNRKGYDNQPFFHPEKSKLYYVSADSTGQTDIMFYDYRNSKTASLTHTSEREYSPTVTPDKKYISCIIQRSHGAQDLARYPIEGGEAEVLVSTLTVGYHAWATEDEVAVFALPPPFTLHVMNQVTASDMIIADSIGRSLHKVPGEKAVSFVQRKDSIAIIKKWDVDSQILTPLGDALPCQEYDMAWMPDGKIIMSDGRKLFFMIPGKKPEWKEVSATGDLPGGAITRLAVNASGTKLAAVFSE